MSIKISTTLAIIDTYVQVRAMVRDTEVLQTQPTICKLWAELHVEIVAHVRGDFCYTMHVRLKG